MLRVETGLHLQLKVDVGGAGFNELADWAFQIRGQVTEAILARLLWELQEEHLSAVLRGEAELVCRRQGCGVIHSGPGSVLRRGSRPRQVRASTGPVHFRLRQVTCSVCGRTWSPYPEVLGLRPRQRVTEELVRRMVDVVTELSYGKTSALARDWLGVSCSPRSLHRAVQRYGERVEFQASGPVETLVADGTKVPAGGGERGEDVVLGFQVGERRERRGRPSVEKRIVGFAMGPGSWSEAMATSGEPALAVTDGETGVAQVVADQCPEARHQRCHWHLPYSLRHMLGREGVELAQTRRIAGEVATLLRTGDRQRYDELTGELAPYPRSRRLLEGAADYVFHEPPPKERTTALAERAMREVNRRVDNGARWSVEGVKNLLKLRLARRYNPDDYARLWSPTRGLRAKVVAHA